MGGIMTLQMDEQKLLADFRNLTPDAQRELLDYLNFLAKKQRSTHESERTGTGCQCSLKQPEKRPETAKEPIFTE
jgi:hypothetical protein